MERLRSSGLDMNVDSDFLFKRFLSLLFRHIATDRIVAVTTIILSRLRSGFRPGYSFSRHSGFLLIAFSFFAFTLFLFRGLFLLLGLHGISVFVYERVFYTIVMRFQWPVQDIYLREFLPIQSCAPQDLAWVFFPYRR